MVSKSPKKQLDVVFNKQVSPFLVYPFVLLALVDVNKNRRNSDSETFGTEIKLSRHRYRGHEVHLPTY